MPYVGFDFGVADPTTQDSDFYSFNFRGKSLPRLAPTESLLNGGVWVLSQVPNAGIFNGFDPTPASRLIGPSSLQSDGATVTQTIGNMVANVKYLVEVTVTTTLGRTLTAFSHIPCIAPS